MFLEITPCSCSVYLAGLGSGEDVDGAGFDTVGLRPSVESKPAFPSTAVPVGQGAIVPETLI